MKTWVEYAKEMLAKSLEPMPHELNQLDWKLELTSKEEKLHHHLSAFANMEGGGFLVLGIDRNGRVQGIDELTVKTTLNRKYSARRSGTSHFN